MKAVPLTVAVFALAGCTATSILSTWKKPGVVDLEFSKVVVVVPLQDPALRRRAEDRVVAELSPRPAVASYKLIPPGATGLQLKQRLREEGGYDGAFIFRVTDVERQSTWEPSSYTTGPFGGFGYGSWYPAGYLRIDTYVRVETSFTKLPEDQVQWAATSRTANPTNIEDLINEIIASLRKELKKEGVEESPVASGSQRESKPQVAGSAAEALR